MHADDTRGRTGAPVLDQHLSFIAMTNPATQDIKELERLHATLAGFLSQSSWTPAMGAQLVSGILPSGRSTKIPEDGAASLGNPAIPVGQRELRDARNVLENWLDWDLDRREGEGDGDLEPASSVAPMDFLVWCTEEYESQAELKKPGWLAYLSSFVRLRGPTDAPLPAQPQVVARAADLEHVASFVRIEAGDSPSVPSQASVKADPDNYLARMTAVMLNAEDARSPIASLIVQALYSTSASNELLYGAGIASTVAALRHSSRSRNGLLAKVPDAFAVAAGI